MSREEPSLQDFKDRFDGEFPQADYTDSKIQSFLDENISGLSKTSFLNDYSFAVLYKTAHDLLTDFLRKSDRTEDSSNALAGDVRVEASVSSPELSISYDNSTGVGAYINQGGIGNIEYSKTSYGQKYLFYFNRACKIG